MSIKRQPDPGNGFIYILSNPSMPNVYKVGLTTNSVKQRIQELSTTGVPRPFEAEKVFEVPESKLRTIEQLAHRMLKNKDLHHGKEFFEGSLDDCITAVQDAIYKITKSNSVDLVGEAKQREADALKRREQEKQQKELERIRLQKLEERVEQANRLIDQKRETFITLAIEEEKQNASALIKYFLLPAGIGLLLAIGLAVIYEGGPVAWIGVPLLAYWLIQKDKKDERERHLAAAIAKHPYFTTETITQGDGKAPITEKGGRSTPSDSRNPKVAIYTESNPKEWVILENKIFNKRTGDLFRYATPEPNSEWIYVFPKTNWSGAFKLRLKNVDKAEFLNNKAIVRCPQCGQRCSMPLQHTLVVLCPNCRHSWTQQLIED